MKIRRCLYFVAIITCTVAPSSARAGNVYATGFEAPTFTADQVLDGQDGWVSDVAPLASTINTDQPASGLQAVRVEGAGLLDAGGFLFGGNTRTLGYDAIAQGTPIVTIEAAVRLDGPSTDTGGGSLDDLVSANLSVLTNDELSGHTLLLSSNGRVYAFGSGVDPYSYETVVTLGAYHVLGIQYDFLAETVGYFVDGQLIGQNAFSLGGATGIGAVFMDLVALSDGSVDPTLYTAYFDDLQVTAVPEPSSLISAAVGLATLAGCARWRRSRSVINSK